MPKIEVKINGKAYPCRPTMGAMLRFKQLTGKEVTALTSGELSDMLSYLYCCVASACAADGIEFKMELMQFADAISPADMNAWAAAVQDQNTTTENTEGAEKKS